MPGNHGRRCDVNPSLMRLLDRHRTPLLLLAALLAAVLVPLAAPPAGAVTGGEEADPGEWPWQVVLLVDGSVWCGGSLLAPDVVLTAAHCTDGQDADQFEVLAGSIDLDEEDVGQRSAVAEIDQNEDYDDTELTSDLSLLMLETPFELNDDVQLVQLADEEQTAALAEDGDVAFVTGFGATGETENASDELLEAELQTYDDARCEALYREDGDDVFGETQVCAGVDRGHIDACYGDSGGPLVVPVDDERTAWLQIGIVSWGAGCGQPHRPTVYTQVSAFADWLGARGVGPAGAQRFDGGGARLPARGTEGKAGTYPLTIEVSGFDGTVEAVSVRLVGLSHERPEDLDVWLVAPDGTVVTLLSDVGGGEPSDGADILIVDGADPASGFELSSQLSPTDRERDDQRKNGPPATTDLGALEGIDPNGEWQLLIADDRAGASGELGSWTLQIR